MKAMILAAGLGTRLRPLTDNKPKALVEVGGIPMLEHVIHKLKNQGFNKVIVNTHHFSNLIKDFLESKDFGIDVSISDETEKLLDTGGGIIKAFPLLFNDDDSPVLFHNVDIVGNADLKILMEDIKLKERGSLLLVNDRESSRKLRFDTNMNLSGWHDLKNEKYKKLRNYKEEDKELAFSGIYVMTRSAIEEMHCIIGNGKYSVMDYFLNPLRKMPVTGIEQNNLKLLDIGKPETLIQASGFLNN